MPVNAGKRHFWEYCPCRYLPVANTAGKCHRPTLSKIKCVKTKIGRGAFKTHPPPPDRIGLNPIKKT